MTADRATGTAADLGASRQVTLDEVEVRSALVHLCNRAARLLPEH